MKLNKYKSNIIKIFVPTKDGMNLCQITVHIYINVKCHKSMPR